MIEIKFQGRGGQGVVVASEILARACFEAGMYPQCYSLFGGERRGAPVAAFVRVSDEKIYLKCDIDHPDHLIVFDTKLLSDDDICEQVVPGGLLLLNAGKASELDSLKGYTVGTINALQISERNGLQGIVNTAMLGGYVGLSQIVSLEVLLRAIREAVPTAVDQNLTAAREAYERLSVH
jgi:2-oxoacid:acceptor oxidoreductase gamma subunit (pyruvate/2-ketoisovalerate family)